MDDKTLVLQIKKGNSHAFEFLVSKYQKLVFHMIWKMGISESDVEDVAQEIFIKIYQQLDSFRMESKLSTWIASVAWRYAVDFLRKKKVFFTEYDDIVEGQNGSLFVVDDILSNIELSERRELVSAALTQLSPKDQTLMNLFYLEEFSYNEISEITELPLGSVKSALSRARSRLKEKVDRVYDKEFSK